MTGTRSCVPKQSTRPLMIRGYSDHAANERTFLAWVRTGIAVIAFGFVIEKFNLFVLTMAMRTRLMRNIDCNSKGCPGRLAVTTGSRSSFSGENSSCGREEIELLGAAPGSLRT